MRRESHVRFWEGLGVRLPQATRLVVGLQRWTDAEVFLFDLRRRLAKFGLERHSIKTRLIEFGRLAARDRRREEEGKPETFNFLGFTHICTRDRKGRFLVLRKTMRQRSQAKLWEVKTELRHRRHHSIPEQGTYLRVVVRGHVLSYGVPWNGPPMGAFRRAVDRLWKRSLERCSQKAKLTWERMQRLVHRWFFPARICQPNSYERLRVMTRGRSPVRR